MARFIKITQLEYSANDGGSYIVKGPILINTDTIGSISPKMVRGVERALILKKARGFDGVREMVITEETFDAVALKLEGTSHYIVSE